MFNRIMVPVDLEHLPALGRALDLAASLAKVHGASVTYASVTSSAPSSLAHNPAEFTAKLAAFADDQAESHGISTEPLPLVTNDPMTETDDRLLAAIKDTGTDLVVLASHKPGMLEHLWSSHGGKIASHTAASVFVVRDP